MLRAFVFLALTERYQRGSVRPYSCQEILERSHRASMIVLNIYEYKIDVTKTNESKSNRSTQKNTLFNLVCIECRANNLDSTPNVKIAEYFQFPSFINASTQIYQIFHSFPLQHERAWCWYNIVHIFEILCFVFQVISFFSLLNTSERETVQLQLKLQR